MQLSGAPAQLVLPWGNGDATKTNPIPVPSQQGITPGAASWTDGFPPLCATPVSSGGLPPTKADMNGGLYQMSAVDVWICAGGGFPYSSAFSTAIGGYPKGARVLNAAGDGYWISTVDNNTTDPDTGGAGWLFFAPISLTTSGTSGAATLIGGVLNIPLYAPPVPTFGKQVFTASGTFTIPAGITSARWTIVGAGGAGGGGSSGVSGAGGGAGATAKILATGYTPGNTIVVTVGTGGTGTAGATGTNGGNSSIASGTQTITTVTAGGGQAGIGGNTPNANYGGLGGTPTNGDADSTNGGDGSTGTSNSSSAGVSGGASSFGGGGRGGYGGSVVNGSNGEAWGSGGGGGSSNTSSAGGNGANGIVIVEWIA